MLKIIAIVLVAEVLTAAGHIMFKRAANSVERYSLRGLAGIARLMREVLPKPGIWTGLMAMVAGLAVWVVALAQGELSLVYSLGSMQYLIILFSAHALLGEKIDRMKALGTFLVVLGIVLIAVS